MIRYEMRYCVKAMDSTERSVFYRWKSIKDRCLNPKSVAYADYGGRGITICDQWKNDFMQFVKDVGLPKTLDLELDRTNNNGNYEPGNVRWVDRVTNMTNVRNNRHVTIHGITRLASEWADEYGINRATFCVRMKQGWQGTELISNPKDRVRAEHLVICGENKTLQEWSKIIGISPQTLRDRIARGIKGAELKNPSRTQWYRGSEIVRT